MIKLTLITFGAACIVGAIVKGGIKWKDIELRNLESLSRQIILGIVGIIFLVLGIWIPEDGNIPKPVDTRKTFSIYSLYDSLNNEIVNCIKSDSLIYSNVNPNYKIEITDSAFDQIESEDEPGTIYYLKHFPGSTMKFIINAKRYEISDIVLPPTKKFRTEAEARRAYKIQFKEIIMKNENINKLCDAIKRNIGK